MRRGIEFNSMNNINNQTTAATDDVNNIGGDGSGGISSNSGILLAIYYAGFGGASPIYGYLSKCILHILNGVVIVNILLLLFFS